jgi:hypothetical protein
MPQPKCPECGGFVKDDYGMVNCSTCGVILFVDMEGVAHRDMSSSTPEDFSAGIVGDIGDNPAGELQTPGLAEHIESVVYSNPVDLDSDFSFDPLNSMDSTSEENSIDISPRHDPLGIESYANSELSQAKDGLFVYHVIISGIDTKEIRESLREAIEDSRFGWNAAELMSQINKGELRIDRTSPIKAAILIKRIKHLSVSIRWEQYAITQLDDL